MIENERAGRGRMREAIRTVRADRRRTEGGIAIATVA